jgi:hypothetical protein
MRQIRQTFAYIRLKNMIGLQSRKSHRNIDPKIEFTFIIVDLLFV